MLFQASSEANGGMSIDMQNEIEQAGLDARRFVTSPELPGSVRFQTSVLRHEGLSVGYDPIPENPHHGEVWAGRPNKWRNFKKSEQKRLLGLAVWFVVIADVYLGP